MILLMQTCRKRTFGHSHQKQTHGCLGVEAGGGEERGKGITKGHNAMVFEVTFKGVGCVRHLDCDNSFTGVHVHQNSSTGTLERGAVFLKSVIFE